MKSKNKFGFETLDTSTVTQRRSRTPGPMGAAVREAADSLQGTTDAKVEQRRQNAHDAKAFREASEQGRVLTSIALTKISTDDLPRDRLELDMVATSEEMDELKSSIRARGQKEPVEVYLGEDGHFQLKKGWRRFTALSQLFAETGQSEFGVIVARVDQSYEDRILRYIDMVEENVVREDLTFAEMAQVVIVAAQDDRVDDSDAEALVGRLYASLHKMKRSYIRSFVYLLTQLDGALSWPKEISRNLGVDVVRVLKSGQGDKGVLIDRLTHCHTREGEAEILTDFVSAGKAAQVVEKVKKAPKEKFEFHFDDMKVTARKGECRIVSRDDFASIPKEQLEQAIRAFRTALHK
ncbi:MAG: ParB N-terminal domain-containing protein [Rhodobacteraceae bacterium]|nr:ParB N-terminal domain-containing protein [Paracoccaceae bacterium]